MMNARILMIPAMMAVFSFTFGAAGQAVKVDPATVLDTLDKTHPRLMLKDKELAALKQRAESDAVLRRYVEQSIALAESYLKKSPLEHKKVGPRLLHVSRECLARVYALGLAWRWTGDEKYARKTRENLLTVCAFQDWNPSHFLDTAEMSHAVGVGYDWLYHWLDAESREKIKAGLIKNGLEPALVGYEKAWWSKSGHNWNQVCNGGMLAGALAIAESDPEYARKILPLAVARMPIALKTYGPDGAWGEGPGYWHYASRYTASGIAALETALGTDFGLSKFPGMDRTGTFPIYTTGPTGYFLNFADSGSKARRGPMSCMFWYARTYNDSLLSDDEHAVARRGGADPGHVVWYLPPSPAPVRPTQLDRLYGGGVEVAVLRSAWDDPNALWVGVKAGYNQVNHGHLDLGNFELDALGVRWALDLGSDDYNLPGYWDSKQGGRRWSYYRLNSFSHSVPLLDGRNQHANGKSKMVTFKSGAEDGMAVIDFTSAYPEFAAKARRGVMLTPGRRAALVQDEFELKKSCEFTWAMTTEAQIEIKNPQLAELTLNGKRLRARILSPDGAAFAVESAEQKKPQKENRGVRRLLAKKPNAEGSVRVIILLSPLWPDGEEVKAVEIKPLAEW